MSKKAKIKTLEKMIKALRADVNKLKLGAAKHRTTKFRASGATSSTTAKVEKSTASPKEPMISTVRISVSGKDDLGSEITTLKSQRPNQNT